MTRWTSSVSPKGQITLPAKVRQELGIRPKDRVAITMEDGSVRILPHRSTLADSFQSVPALAQPLSWEEMREIAQEDHAREVVESLSSSGTD